MCCSSPVHTQFVAHMHTLLLIHIYNFYYPHICIPLLSTLLRLYDFIFLLFVCTLCLFLQIQAKDILGKVVVLHFVPLVPASDSFDLTYYTTSLVDIYNALHPRGGFEVVFVAVKVDHSFFTNLQNLLDSDLEEIFEEQFSFMPWTAIPFSDFESRDYLGTRFPISDFINVEPVSFIIDPRGKVLQCRADDIFRAYGAQSYPFTDRRIGRLVYEDERSLNYPSISNLLASPTRNYVIDNNMQVYFFFFFFFTVYISITIL